MASHHHQTRQTLLPRMTQTPGLAATPTPWPGPRTNLASSMSDPSIQPVSNPGCVTSISSARSGTATTSYSTNTAPNGYLLLLNVGPSSPATKAAKPRAAPSKPPTANATTAKNGPTTA